MEIYAVLSSRKLAQRYGVPYVGRLTASIIMMAIYYSLFLVCVVGLILVNLLEVDAAGLTVMSIPGIIGWWIFFALIHWAIWHKEISHLWMQRRTQQKAQQPQWGPRQQAQWGPRQQAPAVDPYAHTYRTQGKPISGNPYAQAPTPAPTAPAATAPAAPANPPLVIGGKTPKGGNVIQGFTGDGQPIVGKYGDGGLRVESATGHIFRVESNAAS